VSWFVSSGKFQESFSARSTAGCSASNRPGISMSRAPVPSSRNQSAFDVMPSSIHRSGVFAGERCLHISPIHQIDEVSKLLEAQFISQCRLTPSPSLARTPAMSSHNWPKST
jgi:hypothetical protein